MTYKILHVKASPRGQRSSSNEIAASFLRRATEINPHTEVDVLDLWNVSLPQLGPEAVEGRYRLFAGLSVTEVQRLAWQAVIDQVERLAEADLVLISSPMWNFSIPYVLKHYIDLVVQPRHTFSFNPESGYSGLLSGNAAVLALSRAGEYPEVAESPDHQARYLELVLGFMGISPVRKIVLEPSCTGDEAMDAARLLRATESASALATEIVGQNTILAAG